MDLKELISKCPDKVAELIERRISEGWYWSGGWYWASAVNKFMLTPPEGDKRIDWCTAWYPTENIGSPNQNKFIPNYIIED